MHATDVKNGKNRTLSNFFYDGRKFRRQCVNVIDITWGIYFSTCEKCWTQCAITFSLKTFSHQWTVLSDQHKQLNNEAVCVTEITPLAQESTKSVCWEPDFWCFIHKFVHILFIHIYYAYIFTLFIWNFSSHYPCHKNISQNCNLICQTRKYFFPYREKFHDLICSSDKLTLNQKQPD